MNAIKTVIVDDEKQAREGLVTLLGSCPGIEVVTTCSNGLEAIDYLTKQPCDLLLLDIQMPAINGFEVLNSLEKPPFTIFITAYDEYALKAFEVHALDYLLKPFSNERFYGAIERAKQLIQTAVPDPIARLSALLKEVATTHPNALIHSSEIRAQRLAIRDSGKIIILDVNDIHWIEAYDYYIRIHLGQKTYVIRESLKQILERLPAEHFLRVHKSAIVNVREVVELEHLQNAEYMIKLRSGVTVKVSRTYKKTMEGYLKNI